MDSPFFSTNQVNKKYDYLYEFEISPEEQALAENKKSYEQIIRSTGIFGGSQVIIVILGIIRNKILAVWLGTAGIGLISIFQNIIDLIKSVSGIGIETGGVREIASVSQSGNKEIVIRNISLIDRISLILAVFGFLLSIIFSYPISIWAFGSGAYTLHILFLSVCVFFSLLGAGQMVVLHGLRKIGYMVKATVISTALGLVATLPLYYFFREKAIIPAFIIGSILLFFFTYHYRRKLNLQTIPVSSREIIQKGITIFRLGFYIVISSILTLVGYFLIRAFLTDNLGLSSVGLYQAVWSVTGVSVMLILRSMGSDFYPRLCSIIQDKNASIKLINEQSYIVLIIAVPIIIALLLLSKIILTLLYSSQFAGGSSMMNWQVLGTFFKVLSWPLGFILLAKGKGRLYFISEMLFLVSYLAFTYLLYDKFYLESAGIAYFLAYIVYLFIVLIWGQRLCSFRWTKENLLIGFISFILVLLAFCIVQYSSEYIIIAGIPIFIMSVLFSVFKLSKVFPVKSLLNIFQKDDSKF
ncbi:MAG TPA: O-antigen flippase [Dysgonomonas sp.]|nr:O-antigen flippase [Dysgonomonas sp.]